MRRFITQKLWSSRIALDMIVNRILLYNQLALVIQTEHIPAPNIAFLTELIQDANHALLMHVHIQAIVHFLHRSRVATQPAQMKLQPGEDTRLPATSKL